MAVIVPLLKVDIPHRLFKGIIGDGGQYAVLIFAPNLLLCPYNRPPDIRKHTVEYTPVVAEKFIQVEVVREGVGLEQLESPFFVMIEQFTPYNGVYAILFKLCCL